MARRQKTARDEGFTLIELIIAMLIGSLVVSGVAMFFIEQSKTMERNDEINEVSAAASFFLAQVAVDVKAADKFVGAHNDGIIMRVNEQAGGDDRECQWVMYSKNADAISRSVMGCDVTAPSDRQDFISRAASEKQMLSGLTNDDLFTFSDASGNQLVTSGLTPLSEDFKTTTLITSRINAKVLFRGTDYTNVDEQVSIHVNPSTASSEDRTGVAPPNDSLVCPNDITATVGANSITIRWGNTPSGSLPADYFVILRNDEEIARVAGTSRSFIDTSPSTSAKLYGVKTLNGNAMSSRCTVFTQPPSTDPLRPVLYVPVAPDMTSSPWVYSLTSVADPFARPSWRDYGVAPKYAPQWYVPHAPGADYSGARFILESRPSGGAWQQRGTWTKESLEASSNGPHCSSQSFGYNMCPSMIPGGFGESTEWRVTVRTASGQESTSDVVKAKTHIYTTTTTTANRIVHEPPFPQPDEPNGGRTVESWNVIDWQRRSGAIEYLLYKSATPQGIGSLIYRGTNTRYEDRAVADGSTWFYYVRTVSRVGSLEKPVLGPSSNIAEQLHYPGVPCTYRLDRDSRDSEDKTGVKRDGVNRIWHCQVPSAEAYALKITDDVNRQPSIVNNGESGLRWQGIRYNGLKGKTLGSFEHDVPIGSVTLYEAISYNRTGPSKNALMPSNLENMSGIQQRAAGTVSASYTLPKIGGNVVDDGNNPNARANKRDANKFSITFTPDGQDPCFIYPRTYNNTIKDYAGCKLEVFATNVGAGGNGVPVKVYETGYSLYTEPNSLAKPNEFKYVSANGQARTFVSPDIFDAFDWGREYLVTARIVNTGGASSVSTPTIMKTYPGPFAVYRKESYAGASSVVNDPWFLREREPWVGGRVESRMRGEIDIPNGSYIEWTDSEGPDNSYIIDSTAVRNGSGPQAPSQESTVVPEDGNASSVHKIVTQLEKPGWLYNQKVTARAFNGLTREHTPWDVQAPPMPPDYAYIAGTCRATEIDGSSNGMGVAMIPTLQNGSKWIDGAVARTYSFGIRGYSGGSYRINSYNSASMRDHEVNINSDDLTAMVHFEATPGRYAGRNSIGAEVRTYVNNLAPSSLSGARIYSALDVVYLNALRSGNMQCPESSSYTTSAARAYGNYRWRPGSVNLTYGRTGERAQQPNPGDPNSDYERWLFFDPAKYNAPVDRSDLTKSMTWGLSRISQKEYRAKQPGIQGFQRVPGPRVSDSFPYPRGWPGEGS